MRTLKRMGYEVTPFDVLPYMEVGTRLARSLAHRTNTGLRLRSLNHALAMLSAEYRLYEIVWVDKGMWIYRETLIALKDRAKPVTLVHYTPDAQLIHHRSRHFIASIPYYDILVTTKPYELNGYRAYGAKDVLLVLQGYDHRFVPCMPALHDRAELASDVCFVGHCERHYAGRLKSASGVAGHLKIWGPQWPRYATFHAWARPHVEGDGIWGNRYPLALACSKIALGLLSKRIPETTTTRTFEVPATGVFMLAERTEEHLELFSEGVEAEFFRDDYELRDKINFYLNHDSARKKIAAAGHARCIRSNYHSESQIRKVMERVRELHR